MIRFFIQYFLKLKSVDSMEKPFLKIHCRHSNMPEPAKAYPTDSGIDLTLMEITKKSEKIFFFDFGIAVEPSEGYYTELYPRSSIYKYDFIMVNSVGIIDADYRGNLMMPMRYIGNQDGYRLAKELIGQRVAQIIVKKLEDIEIRIVHSLSATERGKKGFGSTGK